MVNSLVLVGLVLFAISDEFHQSFVPGRTASFMDIGLDLIGIFCGLAVLKISGSSSVSGGKLCDKQQNTLRRRRIDPYQFKRETDKSP